LVFSGIKTVGRWQNFLTVVVLQFFKKGLLKHAILVQAAILDYFKKILNDLFVFKGQTNRRRNY
jgi:hypothetical protein